MLTENQYQPLPGTLKPEIWGGIECTINRVGDTFRDQLEDTGHYCREQDIAAIAATGISCIRYPVLWERHLPVNNHQPNWQWIEKQLEEIRQYGITPIAGLLHHGSGPAYTSLDDPCFPGKFAQYAKQVAAKFPWIEYYTPINEPLTTARFSGLYGSWYPHKKDDHSFISMLLNQLKATVLAMKEIRKINPAAKLVQTEDLTKIQSTGVLKYQADFENERRWLTYDLLCGRVNESHPLWDYFIKTGIKKEQLDFFSAHPCPPDIIGCNYYLTSERFLDEHTNEYPPHTHGGNGRHAYADVESVRVNKMLGLQHLLEEAGDRYPITIAVTELHLHCTREEQMRWLMEAWDTCCRLKNNGADISALTVWAMLGSYDWNTLITERNNSYESGMYDTRSGLMRKTALVKIVSALAQGQDYDHPVLKEKGWWHNKERATTAYTTGNTKPLLITGRNGTLGKAFERICSLRAIPCIILNRQELDICHAAGIAAAIDLYQPWGVINTAGFVKVNEAEHFAQECLDVNGNAAGLLARICREKGIQFMTFSSDMVFDGEQRHPYFETDLVNPVNVYGKSKALAETLALSENPSSLIIRTSAFFGPWDEYNFAWNILNRLKTGQVCTALNDVFISPTYVPDLVHTALDIFIDESAGIWHITNEGNISWAALAGEIANRSGFSARSISSMSAAEMQLTAKLPPYSVLGTKKGIMMSSIDNALSRYFMEKTV